jgi:exosortase F-associated protein
MNSAVSLGLIYLLFKEVSLVQFAAVLYGLLFVILATALYILLEYSSQQQLFVLFYVRRFLIQPLFVMLFIPAFYVQIKSV